MRGFLFWALCWGNWFADSKEVAEKVKEQKILEEKEELKKEYNKVKEELEEKRKETGDKELKRLRFEQEIYKKEVDEYWAAEDRGVYMTNRSVMYMNCTDTENQEAPRQG